MTGCVPAHLGGMGLLGRLELWGCDLTGGGSSTADVESHLAAAAGDMDVLHIGHHGSTTSTNQTLLNTVKPEHAENTRQCTMQRSVGHEWH